MKPLRIAVVGVGHMGRHHAQKVADLARDGSGVRLSGVIDLQAERARHVARELRTRHAVEAERIYPHTDAVIVAVPTRQHFRVASSALDAGLDVLLEKPIASSVDEGERLLAQAHSRGAILQVGHQEWFNPAMDAIRRSVRAPRFVEAHRIGPFSERATDVDVVRDLMIHDIDILQRLLGEEPERVEAVGIPVLTDQVDVANARIEFPGGCIASLTASRVSVSAMRQLRLFQREACLSIDFLHQTAGVFRRVDRGNGDPPRIENEQFEIGREDALVNQLTAFVDASRRREPIRNLDADALRALRTALRVVRAMPTTDRCP